MNNLKDNILFFNNNLYKKIKENTLNIYAFEYVKDKTLQLDTALTFYSICGHVSYYNFISNPYPSAIDVVTLIDNTDLGTLYFWTHNTAIVANVFTTDDYAVRTITTGTAAVSGGSAGYTG